MQIWNGNPWNKNPCTYIGLTCIFHLQTLIALRLSLQIYKKKDAKNHCQNVSLLCCSCGGIDCRLAPICLLKNPVNFVDFNKKEPPYHPPIYKSTFKIRNFALRDFHAKGREIGGILRGGLNCFKHRSRFLKGRGSDTLIWRNSRDDMIRTLPIISFAGFAYAAR